jgi:hypothetical protein
MRDRRYATGPTDLAKMTGLSFTASASNQDLLSQPLLSNLHKGWMNLDANEIATLEYCASSA